MGEVYDILMFTSENITCDICKKVSAHGLCVEGVFVEYNICDDCAGGVLVLAVQEARDRMASHKTVGKPARTKLPHGSKRGRR